jgi:hypothetical protein
MSDTDCGCSLRECPAQTGAPVETVRRELHRAALLFAAGADDGDVERALARACAGALVCGARHGAHLHWARDDGVHFVVAVDRAGVAFRPRLAVLASWRFVGEKRATAPTGPAPALPAQSAPRVGEK